MRFAIIKFSKLTDYECFRYNGCWYQKHRGKWSRKLQDDKADYLLNQDSLVGVALSSES